MKVNMYGFLGLLSLLGFVGFFTEARGFLGFFGFATDFMFFFVKSDEMMASYMNLSAARAFVAGMLVSGLGMVASLLLRYPPHEALVFGTVVGWSVGIAVHALSVAYFSMKESVGMAE